MYIYVYVHILCVCVSIEVGDQPSPRNLWIGPKLAFGTWCPVYGVKADGTVNPIWYVVSVWFPFRNLPPQVLKDLVLGSVDLHTSVRSSPCCRFLAPVATRSYGFVQGLYYPLYFAWYFS